MFPPYRHCQIPLRHIRMPPERADVLAKYPRKSAVSRLKHALMIAAGAPCFQDESRVASAPLGQRKIGGAVTFEWKISLDTIFTVAGLVLSFIGLRFVAIQIRGANRQQEVANHERKIESQIRMHEINRELISMGFDKPELFEVLNDTGKVDHEVERRYLQLWLNQLSMFYSLKTAGDMQKDFAESCDRDLRNMFKKANMRRHWKDVEAYYPVSFQNAVNAIIDETGNGTAAEAAKQLTS
jgi:hypothetical protein